MDDQKQFRDEEFHRKSLKEGRTLACPECGYLILAVPGKSGRRVYSALEALAALLSGHYWSAHQKPLTEEEAREIISQKNAKETKTEPEWAAH